MRIVERRSLSIEDNIRYIVERRLLLIESIARRRSLLIKSFNNCHSLLININRNVN